MRTYNQETSCTFCAYKAVLQTRFHGLQAIRDTDLQKYMYALFAYREYTSA